MIARALDDYLDFTYPSVTKTAESSCRQIVASYGVIRSIIYYYVDEASVKERLFIIQSIIVILNI